MEIPKISDKIKTNFTLFPHHVYFPTFQSRCLCGSMSIKCLFFVFRKLAILMDETATHETSLKIGALIDCYFNIYM